VPNLDKTVQKGYCSGEFISKTPLPVTHLIQAPMVILNIFVR
jgi:hypothetical protein